MKRPISAITDNNNKNLQTAYRNYTIPYQYIAFFKLTVKRIKSEKNAFLSLIRFFRLYYISDENFIKSRLASRS